VMYPSQYGRHRPPSGWDPGYRPVRPRSMYPDQQRPPLNRMPPSWPRRNVASTGKDAYYRDVLEKNGVDLVDNEWSEDGEYIDLGRRSPTRQWRVTKVKIEPIEQTQSAMASPFVEEYPYSYRMLPESPYYQPPQPLPPPVLPQPIPPAAAPYYPSSSMYYPSALPPASYRYY